jgi:PAS domain S-box-containing protein
MAPNTRLSLLVVCDVVSTNGRFWQGLRRAGFEIIHSTDGISGLATASRRRVDLILADIDMVGMNGLDFIATIASKHDSPPVIALTRRIRCERSREALRRGALAVLANPLRSAIRTGMCIGRVLDRWRRLQSVKNRTVIPAPAAESEERPESKPRDDHRYQRLLESVSSYVYTVHVENGHSIFTRHGEGCESVTGFTPAEYDQDAGLWYRMIHPEDQAKVLQLIQSMFSGSETTSLIHRIRHKDGSFRWIRNVLVPHRVDGALVYYDGIVNDITERKNAETALQASERNLRLIMENTHDMIFSVDSGGRLLAANSAFMKFLERTGNAAEIGEAPSFENLFEKGDLQWRALLDSALAGKRLETLLAIDVKGELRRFETVLNPIVASSGMVLGMGAFIHDVTDREQAQQAIRAMTRCIATKTGMSTMETIALNIEEQLGATGVLVGSFGADDKTILPLAVRIGGATVVPGTLPLRSRPCGCIGEKGYCYLPKRGPVIFPEGDAFQARMDCHLGVPIRDKDGKAIGLICAMFQRPLRVTETALEMMGILAAKAAAEIERAGIEGSLRRSIAEKEILLTEIHHRVKNNLQIIASFIALQEDYRRENPAAANLAELNGRIQSIALVHDCLYSTDTFERIDLAEYLERLCSNIVCSLFPVGSRINLERRVDPTILHLDQAVLCGIIVNELVSNALKHAFSDGREGSILVEARREGSILRLMVNDDGVGLVGDHLACSEDSLGLSLVGGLASQLGGLLHIDGSAGLSCSVEFPIAG